MRWGALIVALLVGLGLLAPPGAHASTSFNHKLTMRGLFATLDDSDTFAGRALDEGKYNRNVVYTGRSSYGGGGATWLGWWNSGKFTLVERDGSQLIVEVDGRQRFESAYRSTQCAIVDDCRFMRDGRVVVTGGTGKFAGASGSGWAHLEGLATKLAGDLWLTLN
jgi:hypothetical protein